MDERDDGGLATATGTHEGNRLADRDGEGDVLENGDVGMRGILEGDVGEGDVAVVTLLLDHSRRIVLAGEVDDADYVLGGTLCQYERRRIDNSDANELSTHENSHHNCEDVRKLSFSLFNEYRS